MVVGRVSDQTSEAGKLPQSLVLTIVIVNEI
jgi:hypothetical protein